MTMKTFVETSYVKMDVLESESLPRGVIAQLTFPAATIADKKNSNGRIYPKSLMMESVLEATSRAAEGLMLMNADHPDPDRKIAGGQIAGPSGIAGIVSKISFNESTGGTLLVVNVPDTTAGRDIKAIAAAGGKVGVSSRGKGTSQQGKYKTESGEELEGEILQKGFILETYDFVTTPSVTSARHTEMRESVESKEEDITTMDLDTFKNDHPELFESICEAAVDEKKEMLLEAVTAKISEKEDEIRSEIEEAYTDKLEELEEENRSLRKITEGLKKDKVLLEGVSKKQSSTVESELRNMKARLDKKEVNEWLAVKTKDHMFAEEILKRCETCDTIAEAEIVFKDVDSLLKIAGKKNKQISEGKGIKNVDEVADKADDVTTESAAVARGRRLALGLASLSYSFE